MWQLVRFRTVVIYLALASIPRLENITRALGASVCTVDGEMH